MIYRGKIEFCGAVVDKKLVKICRCRTEGGRHRRHPRSLLCETKVL